MRALRGRHSKALVLNLVLACLPHTKATTDWALSDSCTVLASTQINTGFTPDRQIVKAQAFKSFYHTSVSTLGREIKLDLGSS